MMFKELQEHIFKKLYAAYLEHDCKHDCFNFTYEDLGLNDADRRQARDAVMQLYRRGLVESMAGMGSGVLSLRILADGIEAGEEMFSDPEEIREEKFGLLCPPSSEERDFENWTMDSENKGNPIAVIFFDIDNFKQYNTKYTETVIDETLLPEVHRLVRRMSHLRGNAYCHGGDEFVIILPNHKSEEAALFSERLRATFETHLFDVVDDKVNITLSIGVAAYPDDGTNLSDVMKAANRAEHSAKKSGRNRVETT